MTPESVHRLMTQFDKCSESLCAIAEAKTYDEAMQVMIPIIEDQGDAFAIWIHALASKLNPLAEQSTVDPMKFSRVLRLIDTREKVSAVFAEQAESDLPLYEGFLTSAQKEILPGLRSALEFVARALPYKRGGGRPTTIPDCTTGRAICAAIKDLDDQRVPLGDAHQRIADRFTKTVRNIERIWARRDKYLSDDCKDDEIIKEENK